MADFGQLELEGIDVKIDSGAYTSSFYWHQIERFRENGNDRVMNLGICGVEMLPPDHGFLILEVNSSPGLEGIDRATGKKIAKSIIRYMKRYV